jgi:hypothetical protein
VPGSRRKIGIVSTGLIVQGTAEALLDCRFGTLVLDEAHRARRSRGITASGEPNRLMEFMLAGRSQGEAPSTKAAADRVVLSISDRYPQLDRVIGSMN